MLQILIILLLKIKRLKFIVNKRKYGKYFLRLFKKTY